MVRLYTHLGLTFQQDDRLGGCSMKRPHCGRRQRRLHHPVHMHDEHACLLKQAHVTRR